MSEVLYQKFKASAEAVSAEVHRVKNPEEALALIASFLQKCEEKKETKTLAVVWKKGPLMEDVEANPAINGYIHEAELYLHAAKADVGITEADWAIAETGTLVQNATDVEKRYVTTLPQHNILLVKTDTLITNMEEALARQNPTETPFLAFITGPSRTADIERVLTLGVHGPKWLQVIFVDEGGC